MSAPVAPGGPGAPVPAPGPVGKPRSWLAVAGLTIVTLGIYGLAWTYLVHEENKSHTGEGVGGGLGLVIGIITGGLATLFMLPNEVEKLYARTGRESPVSAITGVWILLPLAGGFIWLAKVQNALNDYWRSQGA